MDKVLVFGRRLPNNDSIMSSLVYAQLHNEFNDGTDYVPMRLGELPEETSKLFSAWNLPELPLLDRISIPLPGEPPIRVVLTDHNDPSQSVKGIEYAEVIGVIDHHRISGMRTFAPLYFLGMPWGATSTIVAHLFDAYGIHPNDVQAACLLSAIMTDTMLLKSPMTTVADTSYAELFAKQLGVDAVEFGKFVFSFRSVEGYSASRMVNSDVKRIEAGSTSLLVGKFVAPDRAVALDRLTELRSEMEAAREREGATAFVMCVVDLQRNGSQLLACGDTRVVEAALGEEIPSGGLWLDGVISRKAQIAPGLIMAAEYMA